jgi:hypothetical protein
MNQQFQMNQMNMAINQYQYYQKYQYSNYQNNFPMQKNFLFAENMNKYAQLNPNYFANSHLHANGKQYFPGVEKSDDHPETRAVRRHTEQCWL